MNRDRIVDPHPPEGAVILAELDRLHLLLRRHLDTWNRLRASGHPDRESAEDRIARLRDELMQYREGIRALRLSPAGAKGLHAHVEEKERCYLPRWERLAAEMPERSSNVVSFFRS